MRYSKSFIFTLKEDPKDAEIVSHKLMYRSGMVRKLSSGVYEWLPLGLKVLRKVENIIREELNNAGCLELFLPALQPKELWEKSGRWDMYGKELMRLEDRHERGFCLGPTHEEVITDLVSKEVRSYRNLPVTLYQFQTKFRDEIRPRFGVMRSREFLMKDAYSFDTTDEDSGKTYKKMCDAYHNIFSRCGLNFKMVEADSGLIGGNFSHEFMVLANTGESKIVFCDCGYAANTEKAVAKLDEPNTLDSENLEKVHTPNVKSVDDVSKFLNIEATRFIKTLIYKIAENEFVMALVRGDREINEQKLATYLKVPEIALASDEDVKNILGCEVGFLGPITNTKIRIIGDNSIQNIQNGVTGANEKDYHFVHVDFSRDIKNIEIVDIMLVREGDKCACCGKPLNETSGIEVGHAFKLGTKYSKPMEASFSDENGVLQTIIMGCYGIGVSRVVGAAIEQNFDENGIIWTWGLAPYKTCIVPIDMNNPDVISAAEKIYESLGEKGYDPLLDDRSERAGLKFKDMDLIGVPIRITIGKKFVETSEVEVKIRKTGEVVFCKISNLVEIIEQNLLKL